MTQRQGTISVQTSDIFPIIKKWLYSEHDIFLRELISNATDAITKRATLARTRNEEIPTGEIKVEINKTAKTIVISDNGIGMTEAEVEKYIAQLAFSGAEEFVKKMKDAGGDKNQDIIGKFGLGFYSAFMVAKKVELETLSMEPKAIPTKWTCEGDTDYVFSDANKTDVGTTITLHINEEGEEFLSEFKVSDILKKFCDFMPYAITIRDTERTEKPKKEDGTIDEKAEEVAVAARKINETLPLWKKDPKEITDEEYKQFFSSQFPLDGEPLFWIHLKVDHPFTLEGILYFPKLNPNKPFNESNIKLYSKQVFVSDNVKSIIPDFLALLKGCIDSTDIPLNVSRSSLQGDPNIKRISNYVVKKVADALKILAKNERERYETIWNDISLFMKYGVVSEPKFDDAIRDKIIFKNSQDKYMTLAEYREAIPATFKEKMKELVIYFEKGKSDVSLKKQLLEEGIQTIETDDHIDPHFMQHLEVSGKDKETWKFSSVDAEISNLLASENTTEDDIKVEELFKKVLGSSADSANQSANENENESNEEKSTIDPTVLATGNDIEISKLKNASSPAYFKIDEQMKRFAKMTASMGQAGAAAFPLKKTLVINPGNALIQNALKIHLKGDREELVGKICHYVEDLATISSEGLKSEDKEQFVQRSQDLIQELTSFAL